MARKITKKVAKRRYVRKRKVVKKRTLAKKVNYLMKTMRPEVKSDTDYSSLTNIVGQVAGNTSGHNTRDITPNPLEGVTYNDRIGKKINLKKSIFQYNFYQQANCVAPVNVVIEIWTVKGAPQTVGTFIDGVYNPNVFIAQQNAGSPSIHDLSVTRNFDKYTLYKCIRRVKFRMSPDYYAGQPMFRTIMFNVNHKGHTVRFDDAGTVTAGQVIALIRCDVGNASSISASTLSGVPQLNVNTGLNFNYNIRHLYTDV